MDRILVDDIEAGTYHRLALAGHIPSQAKARRKGPGIQFVQRAAGCRLYDSGWGTDIDIARSNCSASWMVAVYSYRSPRFSVSRGKIRQSSWTNPANPGNEIAAEQCRLAVSCCRHASHEIIQGRGPGKRVHGIVLLKFKVPLPWSVFRLVSRWANTNSPPNLKMWFPCV